MTPFVQGCLALLIVLTLSRPLPAQSGGTAVLCPGFVPQRPRTRQDLDRREARKLYGLARRHQNEDRLLEAIRVYEDALKLDPEATPVCKALIPLYLALLRTEEAMGACRKALDLDPGDFETWHLYALQLKAAGKRTEARTALERASACPSLAEHPERRAQVSYDLGVLCEDLKDYPKAVAAFTTVVRILAKPELLTEQGPVNREQVLEQGANTCERIGKLCLELKRYPEAEEAFRKAQALLDPAPAATPPANPTEAHRRALARRLDYNLARVALAQNKHGEALVRLDDYLRTQPRGTEAYELRIALLKELGREGEVLPSLRTFADRDRHNLPLRLLLARHYVAAGHAKRAEEEYKALAEQSPEADVYRGLLRLYQAEGRMHEAVFLLNAAIRGASKKDNPAPDPAAAARGRVLLQVLREDAGLTRALLPVAHRMVVGQNKLEYQTVSLLAVLAARARQLPEAEYFYRTCLRDFHEDAQSQLAVYGGLLRVLWQARKYQDVADVCRQGLRQAQFVHRGMFHLYLSQALAYLDKPDEALREADKAIPLLVAEEDKGLSAKLSRVRILRHVDRLDAARAECLALLREYRQPSEVREVRHELSVIYSTLRDFPRAEEQLQLMLQADANDATACNDLGYFWADQNKDLAEAERLIRKALDLDRQQRRAAGPVGVDDDKENASYIDSLGWVLFRRGQVAEARTWLEKAASLPDGAEDPVVWDHLGDVYFRLGQTDDARRVWLKAKGLYETDKRRKVDERCKELKHKLELRP